MLSGISWPQLLIVLVIVLAIFGTGYGTLQMALTDSASVGIPLLLTIAFAKIATTAATIGSGGSGGVFGPSMVIGGTLGASVGLAVQAVWPQAVAEPEAFAVVGMAGFFAGAARAPAVHESPGHLSIRLRLSLRSGASAARRPRR